MRRTRLGGASVAAIALGMALALIPSTPAWACSCGEPDADSQVSVAITDSAVELTTSPWDIDVVDLRGTSVALIGAAPPALDGLDVDSLRVLGAVLLDPGMQDSCDTPHPPEVGSDLRVDGVVLEEDGETFIYTGPCSGSFTVTAAPAPEPELPSPSRAVPIAVGASALVAVAALGVRALRSRGS